MVWSDPRGKYVNVEDHYVYRKVLYDWHTFLPPNLRRYKIVCGDKLVGDQLTNDEAEAMLKLLEVSKD